MPRSKAGATGAVPRMVARQSTRRGVFMTVPRGPRKGLRQAGMLMEAAGEVQDEFGRPGTAGPRGWPRGPGGGHFFLANSVSFLFLSMRTILSSDSSLIVSE